MNTTTTHHARTTELPFSSLSVAKMPAHWLLARIGKRVLRPGGVETTRWLIDAAKIDGTDDVVELAPGIGATAERLIGYRPKSYVGVERDAEARRMTASALLAAGSANARLVEGDAAAIPLKDASASLVFGEAMLSMQSDKKKQAIIGEARRVLRAGGRYAIHELCVTPEDASATLIEEIERDLGEHIHVGVHIGTIDDWKKQLTAQGFTVESVTTRPMRLLELGRMIDDEGVRGVAKMAANAVRLPGALKRLWSVRATFRRHAAHLSAVAIVARAPRD